MTDRQGWVTDASAGTPEAGSATVFVAVAGSVLLVLSVIGVQLGSAMVARHRAESAADLGALAGASQILAGVSVACERATIVAAAGGARLDSCVQDGLDLMVMVSVPAGFLGGRATARARAGPV